MSHKLGPQPISPFGPEPASERAAIEVLVIDLFPDAVVGFRAELASLDSPLPSIPSKPGAPTVRSASSTHRGADVLSVPRPSPLILGVGTTAEERSPELMTIGMP